LQAWFQGNQSPATGNCAGSKQPDTGVLRGYVTVDTVNACNLFFPSDWAYYDQFVTDQNVLWGDYFYVNNDPVTGNFAWGDTLVHIEACSTCFAPGNHTFYGRYNSATAADAREPLPTTMAARFINSDPFNGGTDFLVWREADESDTAYNCSLQGPAWYPLRFAQVALFDEEEQGVNPEPFCIDPPCPPIVVIPNESNRIDVDADLLAPFNSGWAYLNLQHSKVFPIYGDTAAQTWVTTVMETSGLFSVGFSGIQLDNANAPVECCIPVPTPR
jgi:hypothetical protein